MKDINSYGYMRVSSKEQNEDRQKIALTEMGVPENNIYMLCLMQRKERWNKCWMSCILKRSR